MTELHPPWALRGEAVVVFVRSRPARHRPSCADAVGEVPPGLSPLGGAAFVLAERFTDSPAGPFMALTFGRVARLGLRVGICVTRSVVTSHDRLVAGRQNWGIPSELGTLTWDEPAAGRLVIAWAEGGLSIVVERRRRPLPLLLPLRAVQRRGDGPVVVPARVWARVRPARAEIDGDRGRPDDGPMAPLRGSHPAVWLTGMRLVLRPARHPRGLLSSLPAPLRAPEPGWSAGPTRYRAVNPRLVDGSRMPAEINTQSWHSGTSFRPTTTRQSAQ